MAFSEKFKSSISSWCSTSTQEVYTTTAQVKFVDFLKAGSTWKSKEWDWVAHTHTPHGFGGAAAAVALAVAGHTTFYLRAFYPHRLLGNRLSFQFILILVCRIDAEMDEEFELKRVY